MVLFQAIPLTLADIIQSAPAIQSNADYRPVCHHTIGRFPMIRFRIQLIFFGGPPGQFRL